MKIALIGYGKMGHIIELIARGRGHEIVCIIDKDNVCDFYSNAFANADVAIEFSTPTTAVDNIHQAWKKNVPVVSGTTGWQTMLPILKDELKQNGQRLFWTSNYSIGVNILFAMNKKLAAIMKQFEQYAPSITEIHHIHKLDAPSGTAVTLSEAFEKDVPIESIREGEVPGTHIVEYDSAADKLSLIHEAKSREGFAMGAVMAAEWLIDKPAGFYDMQNLLQL